MSRPTVRVSTNEGRAMGTVAGRRQRCLSRRASVTAERLPTMGVARMRCTQASRAFALVWGRYGNARGDPLSGVGNRRAGAEAGGAWRLFIVSA